MKYESIRSVCSKSAITPSFIGRIAMMFPGVRPSMSLASLPTASTLPVFWLIATIEGSFTTIPFPFAKTIVFAVPRSMARSFEKMLSKDRGFQDIIGLLGRPEPPRAPGARGRTGCAPWSLPSPNVKLYALSLKGQFDAVFPAFLDPVHGPIRVPDQVLAALSVLGVAGDPDRRGEAD